MHRSSGCTVELFVFCDGTNYNIILPSKAGSHMCDVEGLSLNPGVFGDSGEAAVSLQTQNTAATLPKRGEARFHCRIVILSADCFPVLNENPTLITAIKAFTSSKSTDAAWGGFYGDASITFCAKWFYDALQKAKGTLFLNSLTVWIFSELKREIKNHQSIFFYIFSPLKTNIW